MVVAVVSDQQGSTEPPEQVNYLTQTTRDWLAPASHIPPLIVLAFGLGQAKKLQTYYSIVVNTTFMLDEEEHF
jgi:hypothetical protein